MHPLPPRTLTHTPTLSHAYTHTHSPILALGQHFIFKGPFRPRKSDSDSVFETASFVGGGGEGGGGDPNMSMGELKPAPEPRRSRMQLLRSRFSMT